MLIGGDGCAGNQLHGPLALTGNTGGVELHDTVSGPLACSADTLAPRPRHHHLGTPLGAVPLPGRAGGPV
ncbi:hypothetical protein C7C46_22530, partial [Streptomyces tateyamensis]